MSFYKTNKASYARKKKTPASKKKVYTSRKYTPVKRTYRKVGNQSSVVKGTNDIHFDEKIAKADAIMNTISHGMNVVSQPIKGIISLAEKYYGKYFPKK